MSNYYRKEHKSGMRGAIITRDAEGSKFTLVCYNLDRNGGFDNFIFSKSFKSLRGAETKMKWFFDGMKTLA